VIDVLTARAGGGAGGAAGGAGGFKLLPYMQPVMTLIEEQSVRSAITLMQKARQTLAVVVDRQGRAVGLVTMKDLVEELVGDLENW
jgi:CBS domain containing-hemolysin-like protein